MTKAADHLDRLKGVNPLLVAVLVHAACQHHKDHPQRMVRITDGRRSAARQAQLHADGISPVLNSKHMVGKAVDIAIMIDGKAMWDLNYYRRFAFYVRRSADELGLVVQWGGDWDSVDGPHFELVEFKGSPWGLS